MTSEPEAVGDQPAMQVRCVHCLAEQYVLNVPAVSRGEAGCAWCGKLSQPMTTSQYQAALTKRRSEL